MISFDDMFVAISYASAVLEQDSLPDMSYEELLAALPQWKAELNAELGGDTDPGSIEGCEVQINGTWVAYDAWLQNEWDALVASLKPEEAAEPLPLLPVAEAAVLGRSPSHAIVSLLEA